MSFRLESIKAMAEVSETLVTPKSDSKPSASGSKQALISLSDKMDLSLLGNGLQELGFNIVSTGGTAYALEQAGVFVTKVEELTRFPEMVCWFLLDIVIVTIVLAKSCAPMSVLEFFWSRVSFSSVVEIV
ncbi:unnamed protein product [Ilex paraguariensis]|uniref:MGS-like domain-containing protein n=1 Tax=Ilex paraguariensis TaxID=185542 RepID=A0ABC8SZS5_9AQUA